MINPAFGGMDDIEIKRVLNSFIIHSGKMVCSYRPDHNYSSYAPKITQDMYPSIFLAYRNEAARRGIIPTDIRTIPDGRWVKMIEGDYAAYQRDNHVIINFDNHTIRVDHVINGEANVLYQ